jgi:serine/threonine protein kinase
MSKSKKVIDKHLDDDIIEIAGVEYQLVRKLGEGNRGAVYLAKVINADGSLGDEVCIKKETSKERAEKEAEAVNFFYSSSDRRHIPTKVKKAKHQSTVAEHNKQFYFPIPYFKGDTLKNLLEDLTLYQKTVVAYKLKKQLERLHNKHGKDKGYLHYDLKPDNIMVDLSGSHIKVRIIDLGRSVSRKAPKHKRRLETPMVKLLFQTQIAWDHFRDPENIGKAADYYAFGKIFRSLFPDQSDIVKNLTADNPVTRKREFDRLSKDLEEIFKQHQKAAVKECEKHLRVLMSPDNYNQHDNNVKYAIYTLEVLKAGLENVKYKETHSLSKHKPTLTKAGVAKNSPAPKTLEEVEAQIGLVKSALRTIKYEPTSLWQKLLVFFNIFKPKKEIKKWLETEPAQFFKPASAVEVNTTPKFKK